MTFRRVNTKINNFENGQVYSKLSWIFGSASLIIDKICRIFQMYKFGFI